MVSEDAYWKMMTNEKMKKAKWGQNGFGIEQIYT
jgi:hypothetical protein